MQKQCFTTSFQSPCTAGRSRCKLSIVQFFISAKICLWRVHTRATNFIRRVNRVWKISRYTELIEPKNLCAENTLSSWTFLELKHLQPFFKIRNIICPLRSFAPLYVTLSINPKASRGLPSVSTLCGPVPDAFFRPKLIYAPHAPWT